MSRTKALPEAFRECHGIVLPLTLEYFSPHRTGRNGWQPRCRVCIRAEKRAWKKAHDAAHPKALEPLKAGERCRECEGMGHRRPAAGCPRCGLPYVPEPRVELVTHRTYERAV